MSSIFPSSTLFWYAMCHTHTGYTGP